MLDKYLPSAEKPEQKIADNAAFLLAMVGLTLEDLRNKSLVVDLGAKDCYIERAARQAGMTNVVSVDRVFQEEVTKMGLNLKLAKADNLCFDENTVDLLIARTSAPLMAGEEAEGLRILDEMERVISPSGKAVINPVRLGFIQRRMYHEYPDYYRAVYRDRRYQTPADKELIARYNLETNTRSLKFLTERSYNFEVGEVDSYPEIAEDLKNFLILKKRTKNAV